MKELAKVFICTPEAERRMTGCGAERNPAKMWRAADSSSTRRDAAEQPRKVQVPRKTMSPRLDHRIINTRGVRGEEGDQETWHP